MSLLAVIPARGGSKGIPRKNVKSLAGRPLIAWTIVAALESVVVDRLIVSTDDTETALIAQEWGAEVPFLRPSDLATDNTPGVAPVLHAIEEVPGYDWVLLLQPTSPLRTAFDIDTVLSACVAAGAPAAVSVTASTVHPDWTYAADPRGRFVIDPSVNTAARRQDLPARFALNGALYLARTDWLRVSGSFITPETLMYEMEAARSVDIDDELDWKVAAMLLAERPSRPRPGRAHP